MPRGLFITGTDTDAGKTFLAAAILRAMIDAGLTPGAYKPVASGSGSHDGDARVLWEAAGRRLDPGVVCPQRFRAALAPHHAARLEGRVVDETLLEEGLAPWLSSSDVVVVEGAGGLFSPLSEHLLNVDLALRLGLPAVIVDGGRLGCVGRVLAARAAAAARGLPVAAVVVSQSVGDDGRLLSDPTAPRRIAADGAAELQARLGDLPVALLPHGAGATQPALDWPALAGRSGARVRGKSHP